eukprot:1616363-Rhodomonas_salina.3
MSARTSPQAGQIQAREGKLPQIWRWDLKLERGSQLWEQHSPCQHRTWAMSVPDMGHASTRHGPCQYQTWAMSAPDMGQVRSRHGPYQYQTSHGRQADAPT